MILKSALVKRSYLLCALLTLVTYMLSGIAAAQFVSGSLSLGSGQAVAVDATDHVFVTGFTMTLQDGRDTGERAVFLAKFAADGNQLWLKTFAVSP
jgi:hypothetical protein